MSLKSDRVVGVAIGVVVKSIEWAYFQLMRLFGFCPHVWNSPVEFSQYDKGNSKKIEPFLFCTLRFRLATNFSFHSRLRL